MRNNLIKNQNIKLPFLIDIKETGSIGRLSLLTKKPSFQMVVSPVDLPLRQPGNPEGHQSQGLGPKEAQFLLTGYTDIR